MNRIFPRQACVALLLTGAIPSIASSEPQLYRNLYASFMVRRGPDGNAYGLEGLDPLLWEKGDFLLKGRSREKFLSALDAFAARPDASLRKLSPTQRAVMQHQLSAVFDWAADRGRGRSEDRRVILRKLAPLIRRLALSRREILALPDTYAATRDAKPNFPRELFSPKGPWVSVSSDSLTAPAHSERHRYRSSFNVLARLPGGRKATVDYFEQLSAFRGPFQESPQFPTGTRFALVRRALLIDERGELVASPLVESIQLRVYRRLDQQTVAEFVLSPLRLAFGQPGLRAVSPDEPGFSLFSGDGPPRKDPFLASSGRRFRWSPPWIEGGTPILSACTTCHSAEGIRGVESRNRVFTITSTGAIRFAPRREVLPALKPTRPEVMWKATIEGKTKTPEWKMLKALWKQ